MNELARSYIYFTLNPLGPVDPGTKINISASLYDNITGAGIPQRTLNFHALVQGIVSSWEEVTDLDGWAHTQFTVEVTGLTEFWADFAGDAEWDSARSISITVEVGEAPPPTFYTLNIASEGGGTTNPPTGTYSIESGQQVIVTAYSGTEPFQYWDLNGTVEAVNPITIVMNQDVNLVAHFLGEKPPIKPNIITKILISSGLSVVLLVVTLLKSNK